MSTELYRQLVAAFCVGSCGTIVLIATVVCYAVCNMSGEMDDRNAELAGKSKLTDNNWEERSNLFVDKE